MRSLKPRRGCFFDPTGIARRRSSDGAPETRVDRRLPRRRTVHDAVLRRDHTRHRVSVLPEEKAANDLLALEKQTPASVRVYGSRATACLRVDRNLDSTKG